MAAATSTGTDAEIAEDESMKDAPEKETEGNDDNAAQ